MALGRYLTSARRILRSPNTSGITSQITPDVSR